MNFPFHILNGLQPYMQSIEVDEDIDIEIERLLEEIEKEVDGTGEHLELVVYNDDVNTFEWVIKCFMEVLGHTLEQSEQLSMLIHFKGRATVKTGSRKALQPKKEALVDRGLSAVIEGH